MADFSGQLFPSTAPIISGAATNNDGSGNLYPVITGTRYVNAVYDPAQPGLVMWSSYGAADPIGASYPYGSVRFASCTGYNLVRQ